MQELRDNLQSAQLQLSNLAQTNTILQSLYNYAANNGCGWCNT